MPRKTRNTKQKEVIEAAAKSMGGFFTADELFSKTSAKEKGIGIATVYRSLNKLDSEGKVHSYSCGKGRIYSVGGENHCHFICHRCGNSEHFELKNIDFLKNVDAGQACHFQVDVHGICKKCLKA